MENAWKWGLSCLALFLVFVVAPYLVTYSPSYRDCEASHAAYDTEQKAHYADNFIPVSGGSVVDCEAFFAAENGGAITAIATAFLTLVTGALVWLGFEQSKTTRAELRAYISVIIGAAVYQTDKLKFEAKPAVVNNGKTPAYNVRYRVKSEILTDSVSFGYTFTAPPDTPKSQSSIGPGEQRLLSAILAHRVPDSEIVDIKSGNGKALWVWGVVHYDDVFGDPHFTQFCQRLHWLSDDSNIYGLYDGRFGESD